MTTYKLDKSGRKALTAPFRWVMVQAVFFFIGAGTFNIPTAYAYFSTILLISMAGAFIIWKKSPELANERGEYKPGTKSWDKFLVPLFILASIVGIPVVAGLDLGRFHGSVLNIPYIVTGYVLFLFGAAFQQWAMLENKHFEGTVRIQEDRGHRVVSSGPYKFVRHPGYLAMIANSIAMPLMIGSKTALIPAVFVVGVLLVRTAMEDKTLRNELEGYAEYAKKVRYRLLPLVW